jgi:two-component system sensor histidine kinase UhpB
VEWYLSTVERQFGMHVAYERSGTPAHLDQMTTIHVYRVLQEAMTNVARHAGTRQAWVRIHNDGGGLRLEVEDHGKGVGGDRPRGLGLVTMRERADLVGGTIAILTPAEGGTLVRLTVPARGAAPA